MPNSSQEVSAANAALSRLEPLIGRWIATITWSEATHKIVGGARTVRGLASFEWAKNRYFVVHSTAGEEVGSPFAYWMIGRDDASGAFAVLYADSRGQSRVYEMSLVETMWTMSRTANGSTQRFAGLIAADQRTIAGRWESSKDGKAWDEEFAIIYTKED